jgi:hypothetical protein
MDKPTKLAFSDEATFTFPLGVVLIPFIIIISGFVIVLVTTNATLAELAVSIIGTSGILVIIVLGVGSVALGHRISEKYQINRMFRGEIWECWQFSSAAWSAQVDGVCNLINPKAEGLEAYRAVVNSSIFGAIVAIIMDIIVFFAVKDPMVKKGLWITSGVVFLLFVGAGLIEPVVEKIKANRYRHKSLKFPEPRVWFGPNDVYHEALGHTSLKELHKVTDQTRSRKAIQFTVVFSSDTYDDLVKIRYPVPSGCEERAANLVLRYRHERLQSQSY